MNRVASFFTPAKIFWAYGVCLSALVAAGFFPTPPGTLPGARSLVFVLRAVMGYSVALAICLSIAREHRGDSWLRFAWLAFALNAGASILRHIVDTALWDLVHPGFSRSVGGAVLRQTFIVIGLAALFAGVGGIVWAFHRIGLGLSPKRRDMAAIAGILAVLAVIFLRREGLAETRTASLLAIGLQQLGLILLAAAGAVSILVYRLAREMSRGRLAASMLCIVIYTALRCLLVCLALAPNVQSALLGLSIPLDFAVPWVFALAAAYRRGLALHGAARIPQSSSVMPRLKQTFPGPLGIS